MLSKEKVEDYRKKLEAEKSRLMEEIKKDERPEDFGDDVDSFDEEADEAEEYANKLSMSQAVKDRVNEIDSALNKIETGSYGLCENCGKEISEELLSVAPESRLCENCKKAK